MWFSKSIAKTRSQNSKTDAKHRRREQFQIPSTIDDETIIDEIKVVLIKNMKLVL
jgi:hypothetical protein